MTITAIYQATPTQARTLTDRIKVGVEGIWQLIEEAWASRAYVALGYKNWDDYCTREFGTSRLRLPREDRSEVVLSLRELGLSIRAIASATGDSVGTVHGELASAGVQFRTPDPVVVTAVDAIEDEPTAFSDSDIDGDEPALTEEECEALDAEWSSKIDAELDASSDDDVIAPIPEPAPRITGTDGKSYPIAPKPAGTAKRKPLTDAFWTAAYDLGKGVERLSRLATDDRFSKNADQIAQANLQDLIRARDALQCVIDQLSN